MRWQVAYKNGNSGFLTFGVISLCFVFEIDFVSSLILEYTSEYFADIWLNVGQDKTVCCIQEWHSAPSVRLSVRPSVRYVISSQTAGQNPTKFGEWLAYTSRACKSMFIFGPAPRGPGEGSKGQILTVSNFKVNFKDFYAKMCTYTQ